MTKTRDEAVTHALRLLGVVAQDTAASAEEITQGRAVADTVFSEASASSGLTITWTIETIPDGAFLAIAEMIARDLAPLYGMPVPQRDRDFGIVRLRRFVLNDDRDDRADTDDDGTVTTAEADEDLRAQFY